ncbi:MAG: hypothetical protein OXM55_00295 [Bdellovibrionales bacterium]|nr:hypothetical protein [Bdellovibrionales bacterium]
MSELNQPELAYFLGLCITRGYFSDSKIIVNFSYKKRSFNLPPNCLSANLSKKDREYTIDGIRVTELLKGYLQTEIITNRDDQRYSMTVVIPQGSMVSQTLNSILGPLESFSYKTTNIPDVIWNSSIDIQKYFIRGVADSCSIPTYGDRDQNNQTRICIDIPFENWNLPVSICKLLQEKLSIPVANILWGHPNLRTPSQPESRSWSKEHRVRLFSTEFAQIGFGFEFKQQILEYFISFENDKRKSSIFCWPNKKYNNRKREKHLDESSDKIPLKARKHVCNFREVCLSMGCEQKER